VAGSELDSCLLPGSCSVSDRMSGFKPSEGDWPCPDPSCGNVNFARRTSCNRCGVDKPMDRKLAKGGIKIGSNAAEKSKGLFSADDWQCSKCGNVNWARRSTCNVCNGPQFSVEEERTGLGGGFNERGNVEYKERVESDDEFDDLGRRKKKKDQHKKMDSIVPSVPYEEEEEEEEEDDDDDDEDGDLSKYDLWGDVDEKDDKKDGEKNGKSEDVKSKEAVKRKASRSRSSSRHGRSRSKDEKKRSRRSRSTSSSSSSSSSRSRSRSRKKSRKSGKSRRSSSSSSSSRSRSRSKRDKKSSGSKKSSRRSRSSSRKGGGGRRKGDRSSSSSSRERSRFLGGC